MITDVNCCIEPSVHLSDIEPGDTFLFQASGNGVVYMKGNRGLHISLDSGLVFDDKYETRECYLVKTTSKYIGFETASQLRESK